jgi:hypothetical protein
MRADDRTRKAVSSVQADTVATGRPVDFNLSCVRRKVIGRILSGDATLNGEAAGRDLVLREAKLGERGTRSDLDLRRDNVDAGDLFGDGVLDLTARVSATYNRARLTFWG